jgi:competence protein ComGC
MVPFHAARGDISMKKIWVVLLLLSSFLLAQESNPSATSQPKSKDAKGQVTIQGCVGRFSGDYILTKQEPAITYELQATGKIKLRQYLGQRVEVTGTEAPSMSTSSDALTKTGSASAVTLTITSIKTISKECTVHQVGNK